MIEQIIFLGKVIIMLSKKLNDWDLNITLKDLLSIKNYYALLHLMVLLTLLSFNAYPQELEDLIKSQEATVKKHLPELQGFIIDANENAVKSQSQVQLIINNSKQNSQKDFNLDWLDSLNIKDQPGSILGLELYIFVSLSMPKTRLIDLIKEATYYKGIVVLRGLKNNSYKETVELLQAITKEGGFGFIIDPNLFKEYNVNQVPVFVLNDANLKKHDQITGNISLKYALQEFAKHGDLKEEACKILRFVK